MNPEDSKQFDEIMGRNFSKHEESEMTGKAMGEHIWEKMSNIFGPEPTEEERQTDRNHTFLERAKNFPTSMIHENEDGELEIRHTEPDGWTHTWNGGPHIDHHHPTEGLVDLTNMEDHSLRYGEQPYQKGEFTPTDFFSKINDFQEQKRDYN